MPLEMTISEAGLEFITREEGEVDHEYPDEAGVETIGVGHAERPGEHYPDGITHEQAEELLRQDVATAAAAVCADVHVLCTQNMFDALVSFAFNCGTGALAESSVLRFLNAGDIPNAAKSFLLWDKYFDRKTRTLKVSPGLLKRRGEERDLFLTPDAATPQA